MVFRQLLITIGHLCDPGDLKIIYTPYKNSIFSKIMKQIFYSDVHRWKITDYRIYRVFSFKITYPQGNFFFFFSLLDSFFSFRYQIKMQIILREVIHKTYMFMQRLCFIQLKNSKKTKCTYSSTQLKSKLNTCNC